VRVGRQLDPSSVGHAVVGVVDCPYLKPTHNKQDFLTDENYSVLLKTLKEKLNLYWTQCGPRPGDITKLWRKLDNMKPEDVSNWIQCDKCRKWRLVPNTLESYPSDWVCAMNEDVKYSDCDDPEEVPSIVLPGKKINKEQFPADDVDLERNAHIRKEKELKQLALQIASKTGFNTVDCQEALRTSDGEESRAIKWLEMWCDRPEYVPEKQRRAQKVPNRFDASEPQLQSKRKPRSPASRTPAKKKQKILKPQSEEEESEDELEDGAPCKRCKPKIHSQKQKLERFITLVKDLNIQLDEKESEILTLRKDLHIMRKTFGNP